jgi:hypothetical protein
MRGLIALRKHYVRNSEKCRLVLRSFGVRTRPCVAFFGCITLLCKYHAPICGRYAEKVENCKMIIESKARLAKVCQPRSLGRQ